MPSPTLVLFDVNETLSDLQPLRARLERFGAPGELLEVWFASTLRDGFALATAGAYADFRTIALGVLRGRLAEVETLQSDPDEAAEYIVDGFGELDVHADVGEGVRRLADKGVRMATLTNGAAEVAAKLLERARSRGPVRAAAVGRRGPALEAGAGAVPPRRSRARRPA
jgi:2-haloacid dehalogenase